ncbi:YppF family protein [Bacillus tuaregi]|uniref:YppF family protein n=1 Tax=Bacillus tuaregi TaxID=1816695 RepID=UPI0008F8A4E7|nr:YppF family protein [Bacillus tuaregi]
MLIENLIYRFTLEKKRKPLHVNELLDYTQKAYLYGELSASEYKLIFSELDQRNAVKPENYFIKSNPYEIYYFTS